MVLHDVKVCNSGTLTKFDFKEIDKLFLVPMLDKYKNLGCLNHVLH